MKKGQFYIFIGILLLTYAFAIARPSEVQRAPQSAFEELSANFEHEAPLVINNALRQGENVSAVFADFAAQYASYGRTRNPGFGLAYVLRERDVISVGNRFAYSINVSAGSTYEVSQTAQQTIPAAAEIDVLIKGFTYEFVMAQLDLKAVLRSENEEEVRVHVLQ